MAEEQSLSETNPQKRHNKIFKRYLILFLIFFVLTGTFWVGYVSGKRTVNQTNQTHPISSTTVINQNPPNSDQVDFSLFWRVWDLLKEKYVNKSSLDSQALVYGAIKGMLGATNDPYTTFFDPKETKAFSQDIGGSFEGIGAELGIKDNILTVIAPLEGSPAQKSGLQTGDKIMKINDKSTSDMTIDQAVDMIRGKQGTQVKLTVLHKGAQNTTDITITRDVIEVKTVTVDFKNNNIADLKINQFGEKTDSEFDDAMNQILARRSKGIVLDLRNNPGGFLDKAVDVASRLIPKNKVVVTEEDAGGNRNSLYTSGGDKLSGIPIVVLINDGSASAAEILAGALRDDRGVQLIGKKSFGKGSVQELIDLPQNSSVKITVAKWLTPNGDYIMEKGIVPDVEVDMTADDISNNRDPQLDKAMSIIEGMIK